MKHGKDRHKRIKDKRLLEKAKKFAKEHPEVTEKAKEFIKERP